MKSNNLSSISYNNEFRWKYVFQLFAFLLYSAFLFIVSLIIPMSILHIAGFENTFQLTMGDIRILIMCSVLICTIVCLKYFKRFRTGQYSVVGNNLIVYERYFSSVTNLTIPISQITDVRFTSNFIEWKEIPTQGIKLLIKPYRLLEITVEEQTYKLYTFENAEELYIELCNRIKK